MTVKINDEIFNLKHLPRPIGGASGGGKGGASSIKEDPDSLQSRSFVTIIDLIGEGEIGGIVSEIGSSKENSIRFNGTPLRHINGELNFEGVSWAERTGKQQQSYIEGFGEGVETPYVKGVQLKQNIPSSFVISSPNVDKVRIILAVNALTSTNNSNGSINGSVIEFEFLLSTNGSSFQSVAKRKIEGKATSRYQRSYSFNLPKSKEDGTPITSWAMQVVRKTPDSSSSLVQNESYFESYSEIELTKFSYPNAALVASRFNSETFSSIPKREYLVDGLIIEVPNNYDPKTRTYSGVWNGLFKRAVTDNPAFILRDLLLNKRYGLGEYVPPEFIDDAKLYQIAQYCDQLIDDGFGNKEPRYTINCVINTRADAYDLIVDICSAFNGMAYWTGDLIGFTIDAPDEPVMLFNNANIVGDFVYSGSSLKDRHSVAVVTYNDPNDDYKQVPESVEDADLIERYGIRKTEIMPFGCTSRGQAARYGRWLLYSEHNQSELINFKASFETSLLLPGDLVLIQDRDQAGIKLGGRLLDCNSLSATLDSTVDLELVNNGKISLRLEDGSMVERAISNIAKNVVTKHGLTKEVSIVYWELPLTTLPVELGVWIIRGDNIQPITARVVNIVQGDTKGIYEITAVPHNPNKYLSIENGLMLEVPKTTLLNSRNQDAPDAVRVSQELITDQGITKTNLVISWDEAKNASQYEIEWKRDNENWVKLPKTSNLSVEIQDVYSGIYVARVYAYNVFGAKSYPTYSNSSDLKGKTGKPDNVISFTVTPLLFGMQLDWVFNSTKSDIAFVSIEVSSTGHAEDAILLGNFSYPTSSHTLQGLQANLTQYYRIKTVDTSDNQSDWSEFKVGVVSADPQQVLEILENNITKGLLDETLRSEIEQIPLINVNLDKTIQDIEKIKNETNQAIDEILGNIESESETRNAEVVQLKNQLNAETESREQQYSLLSDGITNTQTLITQGDEHVLSELNTYKTSTNNSLAVVDQKIQSLTSSDSALSQRVDAQDARITTIDTKSNTAITNAATAQSTAQAAVTAAEAASQKADQVKATLSSSKGVNYVASFTSDPSALPTVKNTGVTTKLVDSPKRKIDGTTTPAKAYEVITTGIGSGVSVTIGPSGSSEAVSSAPISLIAGKIYLVSFEITSTVALSELQMSLPYSYISNGTVFNASKILLDTKTNLTAKLNLAANTTNRFFGYIAPTVTSKYSLQFDINKNFTHPSGTTFVIDYLMAEEFVGDITVAQPSTWIAGSNNPDAKIDGLAEVVNNIKADVKKNQDDIASTTQSLIALNSSFGNLTNQVNANSSGLQSIQTSVTKQGNDIAALSNATTLLQGQVSHVETNTATALSQAQIAIDKSSSNATDLRALNAAIGTSVLSSEQDFTKQNKFAAFIVQVPPTLSNLVVPDYTHLTTYPIVGKNYVDKSDMYSSTGAENTIGFFRAILNTAQAKAITIENLLGDDAHAVYLNNKLVYSKQGVSIVASLQLNLVAGANILDFAYNNGNGAWGIQYSNTLHTQVDSMYAATIVELTKADTTYVNSVKVTADAADGKASANTTAIQGLQARVGNNETSINTINQTKANKDEVASIAQTALQSTWQNDAQAKVDAMQIGGTNLLPNTEKLKGWGFTSSASIANDLTFGDFVITKAISPFHYSFLDIALVEGQTYTLSGWIRSTQAIYVGFFGYSVGGQGHQLTVPSQWKRWTHTFVAPNSNVIRIRLESWESTDSNPLYVCGMKLELGNKATDWSPAPSDVIALINWQIVNEPTDLNNLTTTGKYLLKNISGNSPMTAWAYVVVDAAQTNRIVQTIWKDDNVNLKFERNKFDATWSDWIQRATNVDLNNLKSEVSQTYQTKSSANETTANLTQSINSKTSPQDVNNLLSAKVDAKDITYRVNLNDMRTVGLYLLRGGWDNGAYSSDGAAWHWLEVKGGLEVKDGIIGNRVQQTMCPDNSTGTVTNRAWNGTWSDWNTFANTQQVNGLRSEIQNTYSTKTDTTSAIAQGINSYKASLGSVLTYKLASLGLGNGGWAGINNAVDERMYNMGRSYGLADFYNGNLISFENFDLFQGGKSDELANRINAIPDNHYIAVITYDEPATGRTDTLRQAFVSIGGTSEGFNRITYRGAYILVGRKGLREGGGLELISDGQHLEYILQFINGVPVGVGGNSSTAQQTTANASVITQTQAQVGSLQNGLNTLSQQTTTLTSTVNTLGATSANLLKNSDFSAGLDNWSFWSNIGGGTGIRNPPDDWAVVADESRTAELHIGGNSDQGGYARIAQTVPVVGGKWYQFSAFTGVHRSSRHIYNIWWNDVNGNRIANSSKDITMWAGGKKLSDYYNGYFNTQAPANAVSASFELGCGGGSDVYMFMTRASICQVANEQSALVPWSPSSAGVNSQLKTQTATIQQQAQVQNGILGIYAIKIDNNGVMSGFGLVSELVNGQARSQFGVNADTFYIGNPANGKKPFIVTSSTTVINGTVYPPGTWIDAAYIASATIKLAHIDKASIGELAALSATLGTITSYANPSDPNRDIKARTVMNGKNIIIYDDNNVLRMELGVF